MPNLPSNIQYIFIVCSVGPSLASLKSTRAHCNHIQRAFELLQLCDANSIWSHITTRENRLLVWPEEASVSSLPGPIAVNDIDENGDVATDSHTDATWFSSHHISGD